MLLLHNIVSCVIIVVSSPFLAGFFGFLDSALVPAEEVVAVGTLVVDHVQGINAAGDARAQAESTKKY